MESEENFADKVIDFNKTLQYSGKLPEGFNVLNPYLDNPETMVCDAKVLSLKYYNDSDQRRFIIGSTPSRHGAGVTEFLLLIPNGLKSECGIENEISAYP